MGTFSLKQTGILIGAISICLLAGFIGSLVTIPAIPGWYAGLVKPAFTPPSWIFAPVWTTLYILMGISLFLVLRAGSATREVRTARMLFSVQILLNIGWSFAFFGNQSLLSGFIVIVILWIVLLATLIQFSRVSRTAGILLVPTFVWVSFASYLNYSLMVVNSVTF
jgi:tryptophan-rich sensory protein